MARQCRRFQRPLGQRRYRKLFVVAVEGARTEPEYFAILQSHNSNVSVKCLKKANRSAPPQLLRYMRDFLKREDLSSTDEAWLVLDKDCWTDEQLAALHAWSEESDSHGLALSNPNFEYWLLLHHEDGDGVASARECLDRLRHHDPGYCKRVRPADYPPDRVREAIRRARRRDSPACADWPHAPGATTVYRLVERILTPEP